MGSLKAPEYLWTVACGFSVACGNYLAVPPHLLVLLLLFAIVLRIRLMTVGLYA